MKRLANLKNDLPKKSKLNTFQSLNLKGGGDKRKNRGPASGNYEPAVGQNCHEVGG